MINQRICYFASDTNTLVSIQKVLFFAKKTFNSIKGNIDKSI